MPPEVPDFDAEYIGRHHGCGGDVFFLTSTLFGTRKCTTCKALGPLVVIGTDSAGAADDFDLGDVTMVFDGTVMARQSMEN